MNKKYMKAMTQYFMGFKCLVTMMVKLVMMIMMMTMNYYYCVRACVRAQHIFCMESLEPVCMDSWPWFAMAKRILPGTICLEPCRLRTFQTNFKLLSILPGTICLEPCRFCRGRFASNLLDKF